MKRKNLISNQRNVFVSILAKQYPGWRPCYTYITCNDVVDFLLIFNIYKFERASIELRSLTEQFVPYLAIIVRWTRRKSDNKSHYAKIKIMRESVIHHVKKYASSSLPLPSAGCILPTTSVVFPSPSAGAASSDDESLGRITCWVNKLIVFQH